jgi:flagellar hook-length control protein FliK
MIDNALRAPAVVAAPPPAPLPSPPDKAPQTAAHPFAELLRQNRLAAAAPAVSTAPSAPADKADDAPTASDAGEGSGETTAAEPTPAQRDATPAKARTTSPWRQPAQPGAQPAQEASLSAPTPSDKSTPHPGDPKDVTSTTPDASLMAGAMANTRPDVAPPVEADADVDASPARSQGAAASSASRAGVATSDSAAPPLTASSPLGAPAPGAAERRALSATDNANPDGDRVDGATNDATASFAGLLAESKGDRVIAASSTERNGHDAAASPTASAPSASPTGAPAPGPAVVSSALPVPVHSADFAAAFGVQVSVLAKDGVQHAELHLNPAEMGPVSIQITLDGTQARVDFGADAAATRHAIEAGLPELASALRDAGFTLAGGGVGQHSASNGNAGHPAGSDSGSAPSGASTRAVELEASSPRVLRRVAAGGVDLYA